VLLVPVRTSRPGWPAGTDDSDDDEALRSLLASREILGLVFLCLLRDAVSRSAEKKGSSGGKPMRAHKSRGESKSEPVTSSIASPEVPE
jgi:hypothetical protein